MLFCVDSTQRYTGIPPEDFPDNQQGLEETSLHLAATACPQEEYNVPYLSNGLTDWDQIEADLPEPESDDDFSVEVKKLDFDKPQSSSIHPYFHSGDGDCILVGHKCNCPRCQWDGSSPPRKRSKQQAATAVFAVHASPTVAAHPQPVAVPDCGSTPYIPSQMVVDESCYPSPDRQPVVVTENTPGWLIDFMAAQNIPMTSEAASRKEQPENPEPRRPRRRISKKTEAARRCRG